MAKQKKNLKRPEQLFVRSNGEIVPRFIEDDVTKNVNNLEYYKDQTDNPLFMSMKEDLIQSIKGKIKRLKAKKDTVESVHKKKLIQMEIDKFDNISTNFKNTWEQYEFVEKVYNHGNIVDEDVVEVIKEKQKAIRRDAKKEVHKNYLLEDKFIEKVFSFEFLHLIQQCLLYPLIPYLVWFIYNDRLYVLRLPGKKSFFYIVNKIFWQFVLMDGMVYLIYALAAIILALPVRFINEKIMTMIMEPDEATEPFKNFKENVRQALSILISFGLFKRIFHRHKD